MEADLELRWRSACERWGVPGEVTNRSWASIVEGHGDPARAYHHLGHLAECFDLLDTFDDLSDAEASDVELAVWFHDLVYDPTRSDNELRSAAAAAAFLDDAGLDGRPGAIAAIEMTAGHRVEQVTAVAAAMHDVDLAILGAPEVRYREYAQQIRTEYAHVADADYRMGRARVLQMFLDQDPLYLRGDVADRLGPRARRNLAWELRILDTP